MAPTYLYGIILFILLHGNVSAESQFVNVQAKEINLEGMRDYQPQVSKTGSALVAEKGMGFDTLSMAEQPNWVVTDLLKQVSGMEQGCVLDVGTGFGAITRKLLSLNPSVKVISNDISTVQLKYSMWLTAPEKRARLWLNSESFPSLSMGKSSLDIIALHRVLHLLPGESIDQGLKNAAHWLKENGRIYIVAFSPYHVEIKDTFLPAYIARKKQGMRWPGMYLDVKTSLTRQAYALNDHLHPLGLEEMTIALNEAGFTIIKKDYVAVPVKGQTNRDGREAIGIIAVKKGKEES